MYEEEADDEEWLSSLRLFRWSLERLLYPLLLLLL